MVRIHDRLIGMDRRVTGHEKQEAGPPPRVDTRVQVQNQEETTPLVRRHSQRSFLMRRNTRESQHRDRMFYLKKVIFHRKNHGPVQRAQVQHHRPLRVNQPLIPPQMEVRRLRINSCWTAEQESTRQ